MKLVSIILRGRVSSALRRDILGQGIGIRATGVGL
jgi:hypothetical protein